jgi:hypothetical protein
VVEMRSAAPESATQPSPDLDAVREAVLEAMQSGGSQMLVQALEEGAWSCSAKLVTVEVGMSEAMIGVSFTRQQERLAAQAAGRVAGHAMKVRLVSGAVPPPGDPSGARTKSRAASQPGSRNIQSQAAEEPVVQRMMEKFGAEIRIVIDRSER